MNPILSSIITPAMPNGFITCLLNFTTGKLLESNITNLGLVDDYRYARRMFWE